MKDPYAGRRPGPDNPDRFWIGCATAIFVTSLVVAVAFVVVVVL